MLVRHDIKVIVKALHGTLLIDLLDTVAVHIGDAVASLGDETHILVLINTIQGPHCEKNICSIGDAKASLSLSWQNPSLEELCQLHHEEPDDNGHRERLDLIMELTHSKIEITSHVSILRTIYLIIEPWEFPGPSPLPLSMLLSAEIIYSKEDALIAC